MEIDRAPPSAGGAKRARAEQERKRCEEARTRAMNPAARNRLVFGESGERQIINKSSWKS